MKTILIILMFISSLLFASDAEEIAAKLRTEVWETKGLFIQFDKTDPYGWAYVAADGSYVFKLDGMNATGKFLWTPLHTGTSPSFESIYITSSGHEIWFGDLVASASASAAILSQLANKHYPTSGLFYQYDKTDPFGWVYMTQNEQGLYKLEGLNPDKGTLEWLTLYNSAYSSNAALLRAPQNHLDKVEKSSNAKQGMASGDGSNQYQLVVSPSFSTMRLYTSQNILFSIMNTKNNAFLDLANDNFNIKTTALGNSNLANVIITSSEENSGTLEVRCQDSGLYSVFITINNLSAEAMFLCYGGEENGNATMSGPSTLKVGASAEYQLSFYHPNYVEPHTIPNDPKRVTWDAFGNMTVSANGIGTCIAKGNGAVRAIMWDVGKSARLAEAMMDVECIEDVAPVKEEKAIVVKSSPQATVCTKGDTKQARIYAFSENEEGYMSGTNITSSASMNNQNPQTATATLNATGDAFDIDCKEEGTAYFSGYISLSFAPGLNTRSSEPYYFYHLVTVTAEDKITGATCSATTNNTYVVKEEYIINAQRWNDCGEESAFETLLTMYGMDEEPFEGVPSGTILKHNTNDEGTGGCAMEVVCQQ